MKPKTKTAPTCVTCGDKFAAKRAAAGYRVCLFCGEEQALQARTRWCVAPMHKSNYMLFTSADDLKGINNKGGIIR
jgi:predicted RNA-binding Zn-ribbon protein involved in translation (DUF1610 family)